MEIDRPRKRPAESKVSQAKRAKETERDFFESLRTEIILKILSCLSATDLTTVCQVSRSFSDLASRNSLWRRLYTSRWLDQLPDGQLDNSEWKAHYFSKESEETSILLSSLNGNEVVMFKEMQKARRHMSLKPCSFLEVAKNPSTLQTPKYSLALKSWLKNHGFDDSDIREGNSTDKDSDFLQIECGVYACRNTGVVHFCDDRCQEELLRSNEKVCPISGQTWDTLFFCQEAESENEDEDLDYTGRLGRAFVAGYNCSDEREFESIWNL